MVEIEIDRPAAGNVSKTVRAGPAQLVQVYMACMYTASVRSEASWASHRKQNVPRKHMSHQRHHGM